MNTAISRGPIPPRASLAATGLAGFAVRVGGALERWGRLRAARRLERIGEMRAGTAAAERALAERDAAYRSTTFGLM